jgi:hypothetical protein
VERLLKYHNRSDDQPNRQRRIVPGDQLHNFTWPTPRAHLVEWSW